MSTTTTRSTTTRLREAATALHDAETALGLHDDSATHQALLDLARASYGSLSSFERGSLPASGATHELHELLGTWRQELDELRVQVALAEMEARDAGALVARRVEPLVGPATERLTRALRDVAGVLSDLRRGLLEGTT